MVSHQNYRNQINLITSDQKRHCMRTYFGWMCLLGVQNIRREDMPLFSPTHIFEVIMRKFHQIYYVNDEKFCVLKRHLWFVCCIIFLWIVSYELKENALWLIRVWSSRYQWKVSTVLFIVLSLLHLKTTLKSCI